MTEISTIWCLTIQAMLLGSSCQDFGRSQCTSLYRLRYETCGESSLTAVDTVKELRSPEPSGIVKEDTLLLCAWTITAGEGSLVALRVLQTSFSEKRECWPEYLKIYAGGAGNFTYSQEISSMCGASKNTTILTGFTQLSVVTQVREKFIPFLFEIEYSSYVSEKDGSRLRLSFSPIANCDEDVSNQEPERPTFKFNWNDHGAALILLYLCTSPQRNVRFFHLSADPEEVASHWTSTCNNTKCTLQADSLLPPLSGNYSFSMAVGNRHSRIEFEIIIENGPRMHTHRYATSPYRPGVSYRFDCDFLGEPVPEASWFFYPASDIHHCNPNLLPNESMWQQLSMELFKKGGEFQATKKETLYVCKQEDYKQRLDLVAKVSGCLVCWTSNAFGRATAVEPLPVSAHSDDFFFDKSQEEALLDEEFNLTCSVNCFNYASPDLSFQRLGTNIFLPGDKISDTDTGVTLERRSNGLTCSLRIHFVQLRAENAGTYECRSKRFDFEREELTQENKRLVETITAISVPVFVEKTSQVSNDTVDLIVPRGSQASLNCSARGMKPLTYSWSRVYDGGQVLLEASNESTRVFTAPTELEGPEEYVCTVQNSAGKITRNFYLQYSQNETGLKQNRLVLTLGTLGAVSLAALTVAVIVVLWRRKHAKKTSAEMVLHPLRSLQGHETGNIPVDVLWEFPEEKLLLGEKIGHGAYGKVLKAQAMGIFPSEDMTTVAVKMLKANAEAMHKKALLAELKILTRLGRHLNVVNLLGAVTKDQDIGKVLIIVEYCEKGSVYRYLHQHRRNFICQVDRNTGKLDKSLCACPFQKSSKDVTQTDEGRYSETRSTTSGSRSCTSARTTFTSISVESKMPTTLPNPTDDPDLTTMDLIKFAFQCGQGMDYIASRKLVHRDLSARNVLLTKDNIIKICDFGLTRDDFYLFSEQQKTALPVRWMAPESLGQNQFTIKSDVWSYGVLLWEMFTLGDTPYTGVPIDGGFCKMLFAGHRLETPDTAPNLVSDLMRDCWHEDPDRRPSFPEIVERLSDFMEDQDKNYYLILNEPYVAMNKKSEAEEEERGAGGYMIMQGGDHRPEWLFHNDASTSANQLLSEDSYL